MNVVLLLDQARLCIQQMDWEGGVQALKKVLAEDPENPDALHLLGLTAAGVGRFESAARLIEQAIRRAPSESCFYSDCGEAYRRMGMLDSAAARFRRALSLDPKNSAAHGNLGSTQLEMGMLRQAMESFRTAIRLDPENAEAHWNLSLALLMTGNFGEGWKEYAWRWKSGQKQVRRHFVQTEWNGNDLFGRTLFLYNEQGFGDTLQFVRYVPLVASLGGKVILECRPELRRLLESISGITCVSSDDPTPGFDCHLPILSLPAVFGTRLETIPAQVPYLSPLVELQHRWKQRLNGDSVRPKVGVAWAGNRNHQNDRNRSCPYEQFLPLLDTPGITFYSLQRRVHSEPALPSGTHSPLIDWTDDLADFADTAALVSNLDLVICVDTAVAHLAGALAKPVWTLIPYIPDWRWLLGRNDSPWYPTMRLFRQQKPGDWTPVLRSVAGALTEWLESR